MQSTFELNMLLYCIEIGYKHQNPINTFFKKSLFAIFESLFKHLKKKSFLHSLDGVGVHEIGICFLSRKKKTIVSH